MSPASVMMDFTILPGELLPSLQAGLPGWHVLKPRLPNSPIVNPSLSFSGAGPVKRNRWIPTVATGNSPWNWTFQGSPWGIHVYKGKNHSSPHGRLVKYTDIRKYRQLLAISGPSFLSHNFRPTHSGGEHLMRYVGAVFARISVSGLWCRKTMSLVLSPRVLKLCKGKWDCKIV